MIAEVPLTAGRSAIAEDLCDEWVDITLNKIHPAFWENLDGEGKLPDERTWKAIRYFAANCVRRKLYEDELRRATGAATPPSSAEPVSLPQPVPVRIRAPGILSKIEAERFVTDRT